MVEGIPVDKCVNMDVATRERISELVMRLTLLELFEFQYMQTDPNWSNFLYNSDTKQVSRTHCTCNYKLAIPIESANVNIFAVSFVGFRSMQNLRENIYRQVYRSYQCCKRKKSR